MSKNTGIDRVCWIKNRNDPGNIAGVVKGRK